MNCSRSSGAFLVALAGNPNTGKSSIFNALTGLRQHTGNWPGKTVTRAEGYFSFKDRQFHLVDLPGTYSLLAGSRDEEIARDFILFGRPDCTVVVTDGTVLERNLNLVLQILEISDRVVVCVNCMDEAERKGISIDRKVLERRLGAPVVLTSAPSGMGLDELKAAVFDTASGRRLSRMRVFRGSGELGAALDELEEAIESVMPGLPSRRWVAARLLEGDRRIRNAFLSGELAGLAGKQAQAPESFSSKMALDGRQ